MTVRVSSTTRRSRSSKVDLTNITEIKSGEHKGKFKAVMPNGRNADGSLKHKVYGPYADRQRAIDARDNHLKAIVAVESIPVGRAAKPMTVREWSITWSADIANKSAASTAYKYQHALDAYILPTLGDEPIALLSSDRIKRWREDMKAKHGLPTVRYAMKRLKTMLKAAVESKRTTGLEENPARDVDNVRIGRKDDDYQGSPSEYPRLIAAAGDHHLAAAIQLAVDSGLRCSELVALRWSDVDWLNNRVSVTWHTIKTGSLRKGDLLAAFVPGSKTSGGKVKAVQLSRRTMEVLRQHRERLRTLQGPGWKTGKASVYVEVVHSGARTGKPYVVPTDPGAEDALVFPRTSGLPLWTTEMYAWFQGVCRRAGVTKTFHGMRHDCGSFLLSRGVPLTVVSAHLRHSTPAITADVYSHLLEEQARMGADTFDALWASLEAQDKAV